MRQSLVTTMDWSASCGVELCSFSSFVAGPNSFSDKIAMRRAIGLNWTYLFRTLVRTFSKIQTMWPLRNRNFVLINFIKCYAEIFHKILSLVAVLPW